MQYQKIDQKYIIRLEKEEEIISSIIKLCQKNSIYSAYFFGLGAISQADLSFYKLDQKKYQTKKFNQSLEISNLIGNVSNFKDEPAIHCHATLSNEKFTTIAGHLNSAIVSATCEIILIEINQKISRQYSEEIGLNLLNLN